ncbi:MAG: adenine deaminase [Nitrospinae bacterium]|nr:adenine deaminase [Nitrospinota bacterium]
MLHDVIAMAAGRQEADLLFTDAHLLNLFTGEVEITHVAVGQGVIVGIGEMYQRARQVYDLAGKYLLPGFIDGHVHMESSLLSPARYAEAVVPHGTTAVVADPHEIANVAGISGLSYMLKATEGLPLDVFFMVPSCVPTTSLETAGAGLGPGLVAALLRQRRVLGLAEMMNYPGVIAGERIPLQKVMAARRAGKLIDGHAPGLSGQALMAYLSAGIGSDHECTQAEEAREKLRRGMRLMLREGSASKNLKALHAVVTPLTARHCLLVSDDRDAYDLVHDGHMDALLRKTVALGVDPLLAVQMATLNPAEYFGLRRRGAIAPGAIADLVVVKDLKQFAVELVFKRGQLVAEGGHLIPPRAEEVPEDLLHTITLPPLSQEALQIPARCGKVRSISIVPGQLLTRQRVLAPKVHGGLVVTDRARDLLKLVVVERHQGTGNVALGLVSGFGLQSGALASSVAHDSHNFIAVGVDDRDLLCALHKLKLMGGGLVVCAGGRVLRSLPLPIAGLMTAAPPTQVAAALHALHTSAQALGSSLERPFMALSFLALPVIPELRLTDRGLVDVEQARVVPLYVD